MYDSANYVEPDDMLFTLAESLVEMRELIKTAGMECVGEMTQRLQEINPKTYIGTGKVQETMELMEKNDCCTVVFDAELSPGQQKSLENAFRYLSRRTGCDDRRSPHGHDRPDPSDRGRLPYQRSGLLGCRDRNPRRLDRRRDAENLTRLE